MEKYFREQGINGPPYKIFYGNLKEMVGMVIEARSRPMELSHRIIPLLPFFYHTVEDYAMELSMRRKLLSSSRTDACGEDRHAGD
ncbi:hypothetical protein IFM89_039973 [Coptis chinensis]|uniref:Uncharacterized protein n=1 Tax=Coptis chinensis TaxID=261450 RepID=A0A835LGT6_9MAGN|nr:hypothetical protein IFM89_039973 [Coptis chinensis]